MNCEQPGCPGQIVDGYCDECGMAPARAPAAAVVAPVESQAAVPKSTETIAALTSSRRTGTVGTGPSSRYRLGDGLVEIPYVPPVDPADAVMKEPQVPEGRRFCSVCEEPVGRSRDGAAGRTTGFCRKCGSAYSFEPKLKPGDLVGGQYEVVGCLAHGGMGWIYLAKDRNVSETRLVVLKGLLNTGDRDATAAALAERRFLAEVEHPNIVKIYNFVQHESLGYIVMQYVRGRSLKQILAERREANGGRPDPLPPAHAIAYMLAILPALRHLHDLGLLFCDFKLDNVIQTQHSLTLIDLGGVYRVDEPASAVFGTVGYQAPEIASSGPSVPSDLFTVARTLAILCFDFRKYQTAFRFTLPPKDSVEVFQRHDSLYQFLLRGTADSPDDRFQSAEEMEGQLRGVLREVVARQEDRPVPAPSTLFTPALRAGLQPPDWRILPRPQVSADDEGAAYLATITATDPDQMIAQLRAAPERTVEVDLRLAAALIDGGEIDEAETLLEAIHANDPWEWRAVWYRGVAALANGDPEQARAGFLDVYRALPGEVAPKLALGFACESAGDVAGAVGWYEVVARTDPSTTSASFGLARCRMQSGDRAGALVAYERVPDTSSGHLDAQTARIRCLASGNGAGEPTVDELLAGGAALETLPVDDDLRDRLTVDLLSCAVRLTIDGLAPQAGDRRLLGHRLVERDLRLGLESSYRALARRSTTRAERVRRVDDANQTHPWTWT
jgi:serine/threonine-protein kinase PknG